MRFVRNDVLGRELSVLGFGTAAVMGRIGRGDSLRALAAAYEAGITVFDTARSYGYGESEAVLGEFLQGRRDRVVVSTKFGIVPRAQPGWKQAAKPLARAAMRMVPSLRGKIRGQVAAQFSPGQFSVGVLQASVETSLRKLRTDYLDVLFMHEASLAAVHDDTLLAAMDGFRRTGKVRMMGVSAEPEIAAAASQNALVKALQFPCHVGNDFAASMPGLRKSQTRLRLANHAFGGAAGVAALRSKLAEHAVHQGLDASLRAKLSPTDDSLLADVALNCALHAGSDVVLTTMMSPAHLQANVAAITGSRFAEAELAQLRSCLSDEQAGP